MFFIRGYLGEDFRSIPRHSFPYGIRNKQYWLLSCLWYHWSARNSPNLMSWKSGNHHLSWWRWYSVSNKLKYTGTKTTAYLNLIGKATQANWASIMLHVKVFFICTLFWLLRCLWQRFPMSLMSWALKPMAGESDEESPLEEKFCTELKTFLLALPTACTCSRSSVERIGYKYMLCIQIIPYNNKSK